MQVEGIWNLNGDKFMDMWIDITKKEFRDEGLDSLKEYLNETKQLAKKLGKI